MPELLRVPPQAVAASCPGGSQAQPDAQDDPAKYFDDVRHDVLLGKIARRVQDPKVLHLVKLILKVGGKKGVPQGGPFSPLAANIYLTEVDWYFDDLRRKTAQGPYEAINYHRFAG